MMHSKFTPPDLLQKSQPVRSRARAHESKKNKQANAKSLQPKKAFNLSMKHSKKEKKPKGFSKGRSNDRKRLGPIMIEEILDGAPTFS
jgi:hypothetical protein